MTGNQMTTNRSKLSLLSVAMAIATVFSPDGATLAQSAEHDDQQVQIEWRVPAPQLADVQQHVDLPRQTAPDDSETRGNLFYLLAGATTLPSVVDAVITVYREVVFGGVVIDACNDKLEIHNDRAIPGKVMVVRCAEKLALYISDDVKAPDLLKVLHDVQAHK